MISLLIRSGLHMTSRALGVARFAGLLGLVGLLAACGGGSAGSSGGGGGGGGGGTPPQVTLSSIAVAPATGTSASVVAGLTLQFKATGSYSDGTTKDLSSSVTWNSSDPNTAQISPTSGLATGAAEGTSTITATYTNATTGSVSGQTVLTVGPPNLLSVVISPNAPTIPVNRTLKFHAFGTYTDGKPRELTSGVTWASSNTAAATIDPTTGIATTGGMVSNTNISASVTNGPAINPVQLTVSATIYAFATNFDDDTISEYQLGGDGSLTPLAPTSSVSSMGHQPFSISVEPTGEYVYVSNWATSTVSQYRIQSNGALTSIGTGTVNVGLFPNSVTIN
ncbi:MAG: hypothetical protein QOI59_638, partial [Gammaproteobacteria bacterium]|nr:hypothetical protein [Gammaproteobacteria bacterium]